MNFLVRLKKEHAIVFSVFVSLLALALMMLGGVVTMVAYPIIGDDYYAALLVQEVFALSFLLLLAYLSKTAYVLTRRGSGLVHAAQVGAYPLALIGLVAISMFALGLESGNPVRTPVQIIVYFLGMFSIGMVEELVFRGMVAESLIAKYGTSRAGIWKATIIGGVIFGVAHVTNIFSAEPFGVFVQVLVAAVLGMLFSAIYYRTGNLWICVLLHAGIDAGSLLETGLFESGTTIVDVVSSFSLINLTPCLTYGLPVLFLLRCKKLPEVQYWFGQAPAAQKPAQGLQAE